jgi:hypothetical protein
VNSAGKGGFFRGVLGFREDNSGSALQNHLLQNFGSVAIPRDPAYRGAHAGFLLLRRFERANPDQ